MRAGRGTRRRFPGLRFGAVQRAASEHLDPYLGRLGSGGRLLRVRPDGGSEKFPVIMNIGPYMKDKLWVPPPDLEEEANPYMNWETANPLWWCPRGYALLRILTNGRSAQLLQEHVQADVLEGNGATFNQTINELMVVMTEGRFRHIPVVENDELCGIISIGDVVKVRIGELASEKDQLVGYIRSGR